MIRKHFHDVFFNNRSLADFGVHVSGDGTFNSPEKDYTTVEVPGRSGDLHIFNERFKNVDLTYKAFIIGDDWVLESKHKDFARQMRALKEWLMGPNGYQRLEDTYHPDEFRRAIFKGSINTEAVLLQAGEFDLTFNCMPQRFLKKGELPISAANSQYGFDLTNPTPFIARPLLRVYGLGTILFTYEDGDQTAITIVNHPYTYLDIDSEIMDAHFGNENGNGYITFSTLDFPVLKPGKTTITYTGIRNLIVTPRWWTI